MNSKSKLDELESITSDLKNSKARARLYQMFDQGSFVEIGRLARDGDGAAQVVTGHGLIDGCSVYAFSQDHDVNSGAIGQAQARKIGRIYDLATQNGQPIIGIFDSSGAKLDEGISAMDGIGSILKKSNNISGVVPQISVILGGCVGTTSLIAANSDIVIKTKEADYYLNPGDENEAADIEAETDEEALHFVKQLVKILPENNLAPANIIEGNDLSTGSCDNVNEVLNAVADKFSLINLGLDGENKISLGRLGGIATGFVVVGQEKVSGSESSKIARFVRFCDAFSLPVVTFIDSEGFACLKGAAKMSHAYSEAVTEKITVIVDRAYGSSYIAVAGEVTGADMVFAWPTAKILPFSPETGLRIFWKDKLENLENPVEDKKKLAKEFAETEGDIFKVATGGFVTDVIAPSETKEKIFAALNILASKRVSKLPKKHSNIRL